MKHLQRLLSVLNLFLVTCFIFWCLTWLLIGAYYCNPNAEDLSLSETSRDLGVIQGISNTMISYDGRYFTNLLHGLNPLAFNWLEGYKLLPVFAVSFFMGCLFFLLTAIISTPSRIKLAGLTLLFTSVYLITKPALVGGPFVMVGTFVYLYPWSFTFLWVGAYFRYIHSTADKDSIVWFFITAVSLIACIGMNEMFLITNLVLLSLFAYSGFRNGTYQLVKTLPVIIIGFGCILFFVTSPGIQERLRSNQLPDNNFIHLSGIVQSIQDYKTAVFNLTSNLVLIIVSILVTVNIGEVKFRYKMFEYLSEPRHTCLLIIGFLSVSYLMTLAFYIPMQLQKDYPFWVFNSAMVPLQFILVILFPLALFKKIKLQSIRTAGALLHGVNFTLLITLISLVLATNNNIAAMSREFNSGLFDNYEKSIKARHTIVKSAKASGKYWRTAIVDSLKMPPSTIYFGPEICSNRSPSQWNLDYEIYFGVDEIKIKGDTASKL